jgi:serine phosphatase RsbU (regulator of sigma subunit)
MPSQRTIVTLVLLIGLAAALGAALLSYWAGLSISDSFSYQSAVVSAQRDSDVLEAGVDRRTPPAQLRLYEKLLATDLSRIDSFAETPSERAPHFTFPARPSDYDVLSNELETLANLGQQRFDAAVTRNALTRDVSIAMSALVALLFAVIVSRLRRAIEEGRSLVERLQRAFIAKRGVLPNVDLGSVLISATRGSNVGGDTFDAFTLDRRYGMFMVADVSGKGIEAAVDTALVKYTIRTLFSSETDPGRILNGFGALYAKSVDNPETFVVLFLAVLDLREGRVRYASAGHEPAWAIVGNEVAGLAPTGPIVGIEPLPHYETHELFLNAGDVLVVATDGLTESRDARGRMLGAYNVGLWLAEIRGGAQSIADSIVRRLRRRSSRIGDDLAILVIRFEPRDRTSSRLGGAAGTAYTALAKADDE